MTLLRKVDTKLPVNLWIDETDIATPPKVLSRTIMQTGLLQKRI